MVRKVPRELIEVEVEYPGCLNKCNLGKILVDLVKNLLHQRNQIPLQFDAIARDVLVGKEGGAVKENDDPKRPIETPSRESVRLSKQAARAAKSRVAYLKSGSRVVEEVEQLVGLILREVDNGEVVSVSFLFGATPLSPREVYTISIPDTVEHLQTNSRLGVHMFRAMVTNDLLYSLTSTKIPVSNMFTIFCRRSIHNATSLQMLSNYFLPPTTRCPRVHFLLNTPVKEEQVFLDPVVASRRLRFYSGANSARSLLDPELVLGNDQVLPDVTQETPAKRTNVEKAEIVPRTSRKIQQMELCTPQDARCIGSRCSEYTPQVCTPHVAMVLCTPAVGEKQEFVQGESDLCTPAVDLRTKFREGMKLCTPAVNIRTKFSDSMDLCTPAVSNRTKVSVSMDYCTPAVSIRTKVGDSMDFCTPAVSMRTEVSDSMDFCTPAVSLRTKVSDSMDLCTPAVSKRSSVNDPLDLDTPVKSIVDMKTEMKDSGISSPDSSRRECQEELFWFVTEAPVRGFKC